MKLMTSEGASRARSAYAVREAPVEVPCGAEKGYIKVEAAVASGGRLLVAGWRVGDVQLGLECDGEPLDVEEIRFDRPDVARHFERPAGEQHGFVLAAESSGHLPMDLRWRGVGAREWNRAPVALDELMQAVGRAELFGPALALLGRGLQPFSEEWLRVVRFAAHGPAKGVTAAGFLESAVAVDGTGDVLVVGWAVVEPGGVLWLEDDRGDVHPLSGAVRTQRHDVYAQVGGRFGAAAVMSGLVCRLAACPRVALLRLKALTSAGVEVLAEIGCTRLRADPEAVARWAFGVQAEGVAPQDWHACFAGPVLETAIAHSRAQWAQLPVTVRDVGALPERPRASIVVPLYGRLDFVESQMLEWARDGWLREHVELVYVLDDPALVAPFSRIAQELRQLYGVPFRWVWGSANRGFSGANNLGAAHARGEYLVFLNSDVFPLAPGWLPPLLEVLERHPEAGVVGPRLLFAEGGLQHAGMRFEYLHEHGVWINRHPGLGLDPALDPNRELAFVPAVTGACMVLRRQDFDAVGGWDTGYLIGDFEDSDLCLKLRRAGKRSAYLPTVQLVHLERQSMPAVGTGDFRQQVTLWNARRHQERWRPLIERMMEETA